MMNNMTALIFRRATAVDIPQMQVIRASVKENVLSDPSKVTTQMYHDFLAQCGLGWVCEMNEVVVGFAFVDKIEGSVWALFVLPEFEGFGIGKTLLTLMVDWFKQSEFSLASLSTQANTRAAHFYLQAGWQPLHVDARGEQHFVLAV